MGHPNVSYRKTYRTLVPIEKGADLQVARWLARESFEITGANDGVKIVEYSERDVPVEEATAVMDAAYRNRGDKPPAVITLMGKALDQFDWFEFSGVGEMDQDLFDWLAAECAWKNSQTDA